MNSGARRRMRLFLWFLLCGMLAGAVYAGLVNLTISGRGLVGSVIGALNGAVITTVIAGTEIFFLASRRGLSVQHAPFLVTFGVKWLLYGLVITVVNVGSLGERVLGVPRAAASLTPLSLAFSFAATFAFLFVFEMSSIVGRRTLGNIVFGRYNRPQS
jgi:hypothetical protein